MSRYGANGVSRSGCPSQWLPIPGLPRRALISLPEANPPAKCEIRDTMPPDMSNRPELKLPFSHRPAGKWRKRDANKTAIVDLDQDGKSVTEETVRPSRSNCAFLHERGVRPGDKVALLSDENIEKLIVWMGVWRYGAAVCPQRGDEPVHLVEILAGIEP